MAASHISIRAFNAGEFSPLMEGQTNLDRYPYSLKRLLNTVALIQGPACRRPGTRMVAPAWRNDIPLKSLPFVFSDEQAWKLEFQDGRLRFINDDGLLTYPPQLAEMDSNSGFLAVNDLSFGDLIAAVIGDELFLTGWAGGAPFNNRAVTITAVDGDYYTTDFAYTGAYVKGGTAARVYHITQPYSAFDLTTLRGVQLVDLLYLLSEEKPRKLARYGTYDWRISDVDFVDGPFMSAPGIDIATTLTPSHTGSEIPDMTSPTLPSGVASAATEEVGHPAWHAFDQNRDTYWKSGDNKKGTLAYQFTVAKKAKGYGIALTKALDTGDLYTPEQHAPGSWTFEARNGADPWVILDTQTSYVGYLNLRSRWFTLNNSVAYDQYRIVITSCSLDQDIHPIIAEFQIVESTTITLTASSTVGINKDRGFRESDIGRLVSLKDVDGLWRTVRITAWTDSLHVSAKFTGAPMLTVQPVREWRLGYFSDTTGWPRVGCFQGDRLWLGNVTDFPDLVVASRVGGYENFAQTDEDGTVADDSAIVFPLNAPQVSPITWMTPYNKGILLGTRYGPWSIMPADNQTAISAKTPNAMPSTNRGAAMAEPIRVDNGVLYIDKPRLALRECIYDFGSDNFTTQSMNFYASHMSTSQFAEITFLDEPHSIAMLRRDDGLVAGFTYNKDEKIISWHLHDFGGVVEEVMALPDKSGNYTALWLTVRREIAGVTWRLHERLMGWTNFQTTLDNAWMVDCGLRYQGDPVDQFFGLHFLAQGSVVGLVDGAPVGPLSVAADGSVRLPWAGSNVVLGLGYQSLGEISRIEVQTNLGSAQGEPKRVEKVRLRLWQSGGGQLGRGPTLDVGEEVYAIPNRHPEMVMGQAIPLYTGDTDEIIFPGDYTEDATIIFRQPPEIPLPFNVVAIIFDLNVHAA